ncbi:hypothetical protein MRY87_06785 [bacterium]|nr:hypothetical protein [bacterium]
MEPTYPRIDGIPFVIDSFQPEAATSAEPTQTQIAAIALALSLTEEDAHHPTQQVRGTWGKKKRERKV